MTNLSIEIKEVSSRTVIAISDDVNAGAVALKNFIVVIDPLMYPRQAKKFREKLEKKYNMPVKYLFITHYHGDHIFGVAPFKDVEIFSSKPVIERLKKKLEKDWNKEAFDGWKKSKPELKEIIDEMEIIIPKFGFEGKYSIKDENLVVDFYHTGGHTAGTAYAYFPEEKILFAGDLIFAESWPWAGDDCCDPEKWIKAYEDMLKMDVDFIIPGHGPVVGKKEVEKQLIFMKDVKSAIKKAISEGKEQKEVEIPEFYDAGEDWVIPKSIEYLFKFYSNIQNF